MKQTQEVLGELVNYREVIIMDLLAPLKTAKADVPKYILCSRYQKAQEKIQRTMERHNQKIEQIDQRITQSNNDIQSLKSTLTHWNSQVGKGVGSIDKLFVDRSNARDVEKYNEAVARHNDALAQVRRYEERISDAVDKHNELIEKKKEAQSEAQTQLDSLQEEALGEIDEDIVTFLDKCSQSANKLDDGKKPSDLMTALEICFIALKVHNSFSDHIDTNAAREKAREYLSEVGKMFSVLTTKEEIRNAVVEIYQKNIGIAEKNAGLYHQAVMLIDKVSQDDLNSMIKSLETVFNKKYKTLFDYMGIIDPAELDKVVKEINKAISIIEIDITEVKGLYDSTQQIAESGVTTHQQIEVLLAAMKANATEAGDALFSKGHFAMDMVREEVINDFYNKELRPAAADLRKYVLDVAGEDNIQLLFSGDDDRYAIEKTTEAIKQADLLRLQTQRDRVNNFVKNSTDLIESMRRQTKEAEQVPNQNAQTFRSSVSSHYLLSCFPLLGIISAFAVSKKINTFSVAFKSNNEIYKELGTEILTKIKKMKMVNTILLFNFGTALVLREAGKKLQSYLNT